MFHLQCSYFLDPSLHLNSKWDIHVKNKRNWFARCMSVHMLLIPKTVCEFQLLFTPWCEQVAQPMVTPNPHWNLFLRWLRKEQSAKDRGRGKSFFSSVAPTTQLLSIEPVEKWKKGNHIMLNMSYDNKRTKISSGFWIEDSYLLSSSATGVLCMFIEICSAVYLKLFLCCVRLKYASFCNLVFMYCLVMFHQILLCICIPSLRCICIVRRGCA